MKIDFLIIILQGVKLTFQKTDRKWPFKGCIPLAEKVQNIIDSTSFVNISSMSIFPSMIIRVEMIYSICQIQKTCKITNQNQNNSSYLQEKQISTPM